MLGYVGEISLEKLLSAQGVSSSLLSTGRHGRFEWYSYYDKQWKYSATTKLHCNLQKKIRGNGFVEEEFLYKKISKKYVYVDYGTTAGISQVAVKQYGDLTGLK